MMSELYRIVAMSWGLALTLAVAYEVYIVITSYVRMFQLPGVTSVSGSIGRAVLGVISERLAVNTFLQLLGISPLARVSPVAEICSTNWIGTQSCQMMSSEPASLSLPLFSKSSPLSALYAPAATAAHMIFSNLLCRVALRR
jgi:hypothetical protein